MKKTLLIIANVLGPICIVIFLFYIFHHVQITKYTVDTIDDEFIVYRNSNSSCKTKYGLVSKDKDVYYTTNYEGVGFTENLIILKGLDDEITILHKDDPDEVIIETKGHFKLFNDFILIDTTSRDYLIDMNGKLIEIETKDNFNIYIAHNRPNIVNQDYIIVQNEYTKFGFIDTRGKTVIEPKYDYVDVFSEDGFAIVKLNDLYGIIDKNGDIVVDTKYNSISYPVLSEGLILASLNNKDGYIDLEGNTVIDFIYEDLSIFTEDGFSMALKDGKYGLIAKDGFKSIDFIYDYLVKFEDGIYRAYKNYKYGLIDSSGNAITDLVYDNMIFVMDNKELLVVEKDRKWGVINKKGQIIIPIIYDEITGGLISKDVIPVKRENKWAMFDTKGNQLTNFEFDSLSQSIINDWYLVNINSYYGYVDKDGNQITEIKYNNIYQNNLHYHILHYHDKESLQPVYQIITDSGEVIYETNDHYSIQFDGEHIILLNIKNDYGVIHLNGEVIVNFEYDKIYFSDGDFILVKNGQIYSADNEGHIIKLKSRRITWC